MNVSSLNAWLSHPVLGALGSDICRVLHQRYPAVEVNAAETLTEQGQPVEVVCFLLSGAARVYQRAPDGREVLVRLLEAPAVIGDAEAFQCSPHARSTDALEPSVVVEIPTDDLRELLDVYPRLMRAELRYLSGSYCVGAPNELAMLTSVEQRIANVLLAYASRYGTPLEGGGILIDRHLTLQVLAQASGGVHRSAGLGLKSLREKGLVARRGELFVIKDRQGLEAVAAPLLGGLNYQAGMQLQQRSRSRPPSGEVEISAGPSAVGQQIAIDDEVLIGCDPSADLLLFDPAVGLKHARVFRGPTGNRYWIQDLQGEHNTRVNGEPIYRVLLHSGDRIEIGDTQLVFRLEASCDSRLADHAQLTT